MNFTFYFQVTYVMSWHKDRKWTIWQSPTVDSQRVFHFFTLTTTFTDFTENINRINKEWVLFYIVTIWRLCGFLFCFVFLKCSQNHCRKQCRSEISVFCTRSLLKKTGHFTPSDVSFSHFPISIQRPPHPSLLAVAPLFFAFRTALPLGHIVAVLVFLNDGDSLHACWDTHLAGAFSHFRQSKLNPGWPSTCNVGEKRTGIRITTW